MVTLLEGLSLAPFKSVTLSMGMVTLHLVIGVGVFLMPLFLLLFSTLAISGATTFYLYGNP